MVQNKLSSDLLQWLYRVVQVEYQNSTLVYQDVSLVLMVFGFLKPRTRIYNDEYGRSQLLLNIYGPITFSKDGTSYAAPIEVWLPLTYPREPPILYVVPDEKTMLNPNNWMDPNGKLYHPLLSNWPQLYGSQTTNDGVAPRENRLLVLFNTIRDIFDKQAPIYLRPAQHKPTSSVQQQPQHHEPPPVPPPPQSHSNGLQSYDGSLKSKSPPPPLPAKLVRSPLQSPPPPTRLGQEGSTLHSPINSINGDLPLASTSFHSAQPPPVPENPVRVQANRELPLTIKQIYESDVQPSFVRDIIDPLGQMQQRLYDLQNRKNVLEHMADGYEKRTAENDKLITKATDALQQAVNQAKKTPEPNLDELFVAETVVYNQLYELVATNESISDTLYTLEKIHDKGTVPFDTYMKFARGLAREQFMVRALINKIANVCQLDTSTT